MVFLLTNMLNILSCNGKLNNRWWLLLLLHINIPSGSFSRKVSQCFSEISGVRKKVPFVSERGPICFKKVPFVSERSHLLHKCPIYFTDVPFISKQQVPQHYHCVLHLTAEGNKHTHLFQGRPIYFTFISKQVPQHYHYVLHLIAEVNKHHTSRKCQQSNTIYSHLFQGPSHLFQSNSPSTIITYCIWLLKWTSIIPAGNVNSPTRYSVSLWWCMHPTKRGNYSLNRITCRVWRWWCVVIYH